jgi:hypothetical protein
MGGEINEMKLNRADDGAGQTFVRDPTLRITLPNGDVSVALLR